jgi:hypothetical protein
MSLFLKEKKLAFAHQNNIKLTRNKYSVDLVNVVNDNCSWKQQIFNGISK